MRLRALTRRDMLKVLAAGAAAGAVTIRPRPRPAVAQAAGHFYLGSYVGTGAGLDPFRPRGSDQPGWSAIDLRPDGSLVTGRCLVAVPVRDDTIGDYLGDDLARAIPAPIKRRLENALGITLSDSTIRGAVAEILMVHGRTDGTRWKPLRPERTTRRYRIYLGGVLFDVPVIAGGVSISENWNCADSASLTCQLTWTEFLGTQWEILTNQARCLTDGNNPRSARADSDLATDDQECQLTVVDYAPGGVPGDYILAGPTCRKDATATVTFYSFWGGPGTGQSHALSKHVDSVRTDMQTQADVPLDGDVLRVTADGSTIKGFRNGVEKTSVTDVSIVDNLRCGIWAQGLGIASEVSCDTWSAADLGAAAGAGSEEDAFEDDTVIPWPWLRR